MKDELDYSLENTSGSEAAYQREGNCGVNTHNKNMQGSGIRLEHPKPWGVSVDGKNLIDDLTSILSDYIVAPADVITVIAFWVLHAHTFRVANHTPRLNISAPEKGCGKTLILDLLEHLTPKAIRTENVSTAVMFRLINAVQPTLLIDEYDTFLRGNDELRGVLNAGWQSNGKHLRCVGKSHEVRSFKTFSPVALAGIRNLPETLCDRSIIIRMKRATKEEIRNIKRFDSRHTYGLDKLCQKAARWADDHTDELSQHEPAMPEALYNRSADRWRHLFSIADVIGNDWPVKLRKIAAQYEAADDDESLGTLLLEDIRNIISDSKFIASSKLVYALCNIEERQWAEYGRQEKPLTPVNLARLLKPYGIKPRQIKALNGKGYYLSQFSDAFNRYLSSGNETPKLSRGNNSLDEINSKPDCELVSCEHQDKPLINHDGFEVSTHSGGVLIGSMPGDLINAGNAACDGLSITVYEFLMHLDSVDQQTIINNPEEGRILAEATEYKMRRTV